MMKYIKLIIQFTIVAIVLSSCTDDKIKTDSPTKLTKAQRIDMMAEMEILMTKDPATGKVPKNTLHEIKQEIIKNNRIQQNRAGEEWIERGPDNVGGRTRAVLIDANDPTGNTLIVGSVAGGLWKCTNASTTADWERLNYNGNPSIGAIVQDPADPNIIYLGTGEGWFNADAYLGDGIYKSIDRGNNWERLPATSNGDFDFVQKILFTADGNILAATRLSGLQMSEDGGESWTGVLTNSNQGFSNRTADIEITADGTLFASAGIFSQDGVYRSDDGGFTWTFLSLGESNYERIELGTSLGDPDMVVAILQNTITRAADRILKSTDKGETWDSLTVPTLGNGVDNFARNQAWYDLSIGIDPNNSDAMFVGGVNLYKTVDGGSSWAQMSNVHADQHFAQYIGISSNNAYFANDGGLWLSQNASSSFPGVRDLSNGYVSTQFYATDLHPDAGRNIYLAGAQDNGTIQLNQSGLGSGNRVMGGDGAWCHISQIDPNVQVGSFQNGVFRATLTGDLRNNSTQYPHEGETFFINPTELDDENLVVFASQSAGNCYRTNLLFGVSDSIAFTPVGDGRLTAFKLDPTDNDILYVGTETGAIFRVRNPTSNNPTSARLFQGVGFCRNIEVDVRNSDRIIATYSNFGINSVFLSEDRGQSWESIHGDLPDIPVRWGIFSPRDTSEILIATEIGIWSGIVDGDSTAWTVISPEIGLSRVDMLRVRSSDLQVVAATYGRGIYTSNSFAIPGLQFVDAELSIMPDGTFDEEFCDPVDMLPVQINTPAAFDMDVPFTIVLNEEESTAVEGIDFIIPNQELNLLAGETTLSFEVLVFDDDVVSVDKTIVLDIESENRIFQGSTTINMIENDTPLFVNSKPREVLVGAASPILLPYVFHGSWDGATTQMLYRKDVLEGYGVNADVIIGIGFDVEGLESAQPYSGYTISIAEVELDAFSSELVQDADFVTVFSGEVRAVEGRNNFNFDIPFDYTGEGSLLVQICFDNDSNSLSNPVTSMFTNYQAVVSVFDNASDGCPTVGTQDQLSLLPVAHFIVGEEQDLFTQTEREFATTISTDEIAYFNGSDSLFMVAEHDGLSSICLSAQLLSSSADVVVTTSDTPQLFVDRIHEIEGTEEDSLTITFYMPAGGSQQWLSDDTQVLYAQELSDDWIGIEPISINILETIIEFTFRTQGDGIYTVGDQEFIVSSTTDIQIDESYDAVRIHDISGRLISTSESVDGLPLGIYVKTFLKEGRVLGSKKILVN